MAFLIREADLDRDLPLLRDTLNANRTRQMTADYFQWLYLQNPVGRARAWIVVDDRTDAVAGFTAVFPRRVRAQGQRGVLLGWNCGDFSIHRSYRSGGAAVKLRRAAREGVDRGESAFLYAHPNDRMLPVHLRVGHSAMGQMVRYARPLRSSNGALGGLSCAALRLAGLDWLPRRVDDVETVVNPLAAEFDELYDRVAPALGTSVVRDAAYVKWRFGAGPSPCQIIASRRGGRLTGFIAWREDDDAAIIKDWLAVDRRAWATLVRSVLSAARGRRLRAATVTALETNPDWAWFRRFGFFKRPEVSTAVSYAPEGCAYRRSVLEASAWFMTVGDRDV